MNDEVKVKLLKVAARLTETEIALRTEELKQGEAEKIVEALFSNYVKVAVNQFYSQNFDPPNH